MAADLHELAVGREHYYTREIARNREEYLSGKAESPGVFHGGSARALGLGGVLGRVLRDARDAERALAAGGR